MLADRILRGENGKLRRELVERSLGFVWFVRRRYGFFCVPCAEVRGHLVEEAVQTAFTAYPSSGRPFIRCLNNAFRHCCRGYRRQKKRDRSEALCEELGLEALPDRHVRPAPVDQAAFGEKLEIVRRLLRQESVFCQRVLGMWARGSTDKEIALRLGTEPSVCKNERRSNIRRVRGMLPPGLMD